MRILILTGKFGMGHYSAAQSIKEDILKEGDKVHVEILDLVDYLMPKLSPTIYSSFDLMVKRASRVYNYFYRHTIDSGYKSNLPFLNNFVLKVGSLIDRKKPDLLISTLPLCSRLISEYKRKHGSHIPLLTCITDVSIHNEWISPYTNLYMVANERVRENLIKNRVDPSNIVVTGIPVRSKFKNLLVQKTSYPRKERTLLVMGGGLGLIPLREDFYERLSREEGLKTIVIMGKNKKAYDKLVNKYDNIEVLGYTEQVENYMAQADLIIGKAGGITTFESIYSGLPLLILPPFLEQERSNAAFIEENNIGEIVWDKSVDMAEGALALINDDIRLTRMRINMDKIKSDISKMDFLSIMKRFSRAV